MCVCIVLYVCVCVCIMVCCDIYNTMRTRYTMHKCVQVKVNCNVEYGDCMKSKGDKIEMPCIL